MGHISLIIIVIIMIFVEKIHKKTFANAAEITKFVNPFFQECFLLHIIMNHNNGS